MSDTPLIQQIIEQDLINKKFVEPEKVKYKTSGKKKKKVKKARKEGYEKLAKQVALSFVEASRYPLDTSSISTCQIKSFESEYGSSNGYSQAMGFSVPSDIPGSKVLSIDRLHVALSNVQSAISRVTKLDAIFNFNHKDAVSWSLAPYYDQILAEIENLPRITLTEFFENYNTRTCYILKMGRVQECLDPQFLELCKKLHSKIFTSTQSFASTVGFLSAIVRQIAVRKVALPENLKKALEEINNHFIFFAIVPGRVFYAGHKASFVSSRVVQANNTKRLVLHNEKSYAFKKSGKANYYYFRGRDCPEWVITCKAKDMEKRKTAFFRLNVEQRRVVLERLGPKSIIRSLGAKTIDTQGDYKLLEVEIPVASPWGGTTRRACKFLQMKNPSMDDHHLEGVDNSCKTVEEAIKWRNHGATTLPLALT
jgi:hypothetical protein